MPLWVTPRGVIGRIRSQIGHGERVRIVEYEKGQQAEHEIADRVGHDRLDDHRPEIRQYF